MTTKIDPFLGLQYGEDKGADDWNVWNDTNLVLIGSTQHIYVKSATTTTPAAVVNGERWIVPTGATGIWASHVGEIACAIEGTYTYVTPKLGMRAIAEDTADHLFYFGSAWNDEDDYGSLPALISCAYPLALTSGQAASLGFFAELATPSSQVARHTVIGGLGSSRTYGQTTDISSPQTFVLNSGKPVLEFKFTTDSIVTAGAIDTVASIVNAGTSANVVKIVIGSTVGAHDIAVIKGAATTVYTAAIATGVNVAGIEFNSVAGTYRVIINGVAVALSDDTYTPIAAAIPLLTVTESLSVNAANAGKIFEMEARSSGADIAQTYGAGANDICGNTL